MTQNNIHQQKVHREQQFASEFAVQYVNVSANMTLFHLDAGVDLQ